MSVAERAAALQGDLQAEWRTLGPDAVAARLRDFSVEDLVVLVMLNIAPVL